MKDLYPHVRDEVKAHAIAITIGKYHNSAALIQRVGLDDWLAVLAVIIDREIQKAVRQYGEDLPSLHIETEANPPLLADRLIARWKSEPSLQERFPQFLDYVDAVESMLEGQRPMESALLP